MIKKSVAGIFIFLSFSLLGKSVLDNEFKVSSFGNIDTSNKDMVILFHGLYGKMKSLSPIADFLEKEGYSGINIQYPTASHTVEEMSEKYIAPQIESQLQLLDNVNRLRKAKGEEELKLNFVVHSLGSVILRYYLKDNKPESLGKVVFISPPSHGSQLADIPLLKDLEWLLGPVISQVKTDEGSLVNSLGEPDYRCFVLIGDQSANSLSSLIISEEDDGLVPLSSARLENCNFSIIEGADHSSILKDERTFEKIKNYFNE